MSFIEEARRAQIIEATIAVLSEVGYGNTTLKRVGEQVGISASLVAYHFASKQELLDATLAWLLGARAQRLERALEGARTYSDQLRAIIVDETLATCSHPTEFRALTEIVFNVRTEAGAIQILQHDQQRSFTSLLEVIEQGVTAGEFRQVNAREVAMIVDGARDTFLASISAGNESYPDVFVETLFNMVYSWLTRGGNS